MTPDTRFHCALPGPAKSVTEHARLKLGSRTLGEALFALAQIVAEDTELSAVIVARYRASLTR